MLSLNFKVRQLTEVSAILTRVCKNCDDSLVITLSESFEYQLGGVVQVRILDSVEPK